MRKDNELWNKLCTLDALKKGWHLARTDMQLDFIKEPFSNETFGFFSEENLTELLRLLKTGQFTPSPLKRIPIPKGTLGSGLIKSTK